MWIVRVFLPLLCVAYVMTSPLVTDPVPTGPPIPTPPPGRRPPEIPRLEDLQRGVGIGDPSDHFHQIILMENGKVSEKSIEQLEQYILHHTTEHDGFGEGHEREIYESQAAYQRLIQAIIAGDQTAINKELQKAEQYMVAGGLTIEDARQAADEEQSNRRKRYLLKQFNALWDQCIIPYEYGEGFTGQSSVQPAMQTYEYYTGFRFVLWNDTVQALYGLSHNNRLTYVHGGGCWSYVGNTRWLGQDISCCSGSTCVHEIGHAIGFMHEQESPLRDDHLRIEWKGINKNYWSQYFRTPKKDSVLFGYYDPTSVMHYWNGGFGVNYKDTFTTMEPDRDFLVSRDTRYFYFFQEAMASHNCWDLFCTESRSCENGGYPSVIGGECSCVCPYGLDSETNCTTPETSDELLADLAWPAGSFTILNSLDGCPDDFALGWQYHEPSNYIWGSSTYHAKPRWDYWYAEHEFCSRIDDGANGSGGDWPKGSYCIYRRGGTCPAGFESGYIQMDDAVLTDIANTTTGELPDGVYGANTRWEFCCRNDGSSGKAIQLPTRHPFILFSTNNCQEVEDMTVSEEYFNWRSGNADNYTASGGSLPDMYFYSEGHFNLYFCYYSHINKDSGVIYTLDSSHATTPLTVQSPNYPSHYGNNMECTYTFMAPENTTVQLDIIDFDVFCPDTLEIGFSLPGHTGKQYCGGGFEKTIITSENYLRLTLLSGDSSSANRGFSAEIKVISDESLCYANADKDRSYSGDVDHTQNFEPCLPWNEAQNCRFHRFTPETFDYDLSENYCRNTGLGTGPWCYTNTETCARDNCDACGIYRCYDVFDDCDDLISEDSSFCSTNMDGQALRGCRNTCDMCTDASTTATCSPPSDVDNIAPTPIKSVYMIGEQVEYVCPLDNNNDWRVRTCTSSGTWTDLNFVCGACPDGWGLVKGRCYKWFEEYRTKNSAQATCEANHAMLATIQFKEQEDYINRIVELDVEETESYWLGMTRNSANQMEWMDGTEFTYTNWDTDEPSTWADCVFTYGMWLVTHCSNKLTFVCMHIPSQRTTCADQINNCDDMLQDTPDLCLRHTDYAEANCPLSCGVCTNTDTGTIQSDESYSDDHWINVREIRPETAQIRNRLAAIRQEIIDREKRAAFDGCGPITIPSTTTSTTIESSTTSSTSGPTTSTTTSPVSASTTTSAPVAGSCTDPGIPKNGNRVTDSGNITPGQIYEYTCNVGYSLGDGNLIRACLLSGQLTGSVPSCDPSSSVAEPVNERSIHRRSSRGSRGYIYTAINDDLYITKTGKLTTWRFYCNYNGDISLQVWRFVNNNTVSGTFIGENTINSTGTDRIRTVEISAADQIDVQYGDVIAVHYPSSNYAGVPYTRCSTSYEPKQGNQIRGPRQAPSSLVKGDKYSFNEDSTDCKTWSLNAFIK